MMVWKMYILSKMAILGVYVRFQGGTPESNKPGFENANCFPNANEYFVI